MNLRRSMTFGFETTWTVPNWWQEDSFCSGWESPRKLELMKAMADGLARRCGGEIEASKDSYDADQFVVRLPDGHFFGVTSEPGSIEITTPPALIDEIVPKLQPLFDSASDCGLVTYRTWWYGLKGGTQGGCHLNMCGYTADESPWKRDPLLLLKYFAYFHNRPWLHYPFMGPDVGMGGNCMRMDEQNEERPTSPARFMELREKVQGGLRPSCDEIYAHFAGVPLREVKHSAPTLRKARDPLYLVEDRAVEMVRTAEDARLLSELRLRILEKLQAEAEIEALADFGPALHGEMLSHDFLWERFSGLVRELGMDPEDFAWYFERQFFPLREGPAQPGRFFVREGRRERKVEGVNEARGTLILSKKIDTRFKRFEIHLEKGLRARVNGRDMDPGPYGVLLDVYVPFGNERPRPVVVHVEALDASGRAVEAATFDPNAMMTREPLDKGFAPRGAVAARSPGWYVVEDDREFCVTEE